MKPLLSGTDKKGLFYFWPGWQSYRMNAEDKGVFFLFAAGREEGGALSFVHLGKDGFL